MTLSIKKALSIATIAMTAMFSSASATAGLIVVTPTQTQTFSFSDLVSGAQTLAFNGFDSTLGTLNSVTMSWSITQTLNNVLINITGAPLAVGSPNPVNATSTTTFTGTGIAALLTGTNNLTTPGYVGLVPGLSVPTTVGTITGTGVTGSTTSTSGLAGYIGGLNLFNVSVAYSGNQGGSVPANVFSGNTGIMNGTATLFYTYTNVPVPGTIALLGLGLLGLAGMRRKAMF